jgi:hypothetical protein
MATVLYAIEHDPEHRWNSLDVFKRERGSKGRVYRYNIWTEDRGFVVGHMFRSCTEDVLAWLRGEYPDLVWHKSR